MAHLIIQDPVSKMVTKLRTPKVDKKSGKVITHRTTYLTANAYYEATDYHVRRRIMNFAKDWILPYLQGIPKMQKARITLTYHHPQDTLDLDNKASFWLKVILDLMKTPTDKQLQRAWEKGYQIKTLSCIHDDSVRYIDQLDLRWKRGAHCLELEILGIPFTEQKELFTD